MRTCNTMAGRYTYVYTERDTIFIYLFIFIFHHLTIVSLNFITLSREYLRRKKKIKLQKRNFIDGTV